MTNTRKFDYLKAALCFWFCANSIVGLPQNPVELDQPDSAEYYNQRGDSLLRENQYFAAIGIYETLISNFKQEDQPTKVAYYHDQIGKIYRYLADYSSAHQHFIQALVIRDSLNSELRPLSHLFLGTIEGGRDNNQQALKHFFTALYLAEEISDSIRIGQSLNNIGLEYLNQGKPDSALLFLEKAYTCKISTKSSPDDLSNTVNT